MADNPDVIPVSTDEHFPNLRVYAARNVGIAIGFQQLEDGGFFLSLRNFVVGGSYFAAGIAAGWLILDSGILLRYVPPGLPLALAVLLTLFLFMFCLPLALCLWTEIARAAVSGAPGNPA